MRGFGCSGGKHSKYSPIWLKIKIHINKKNLMGNLQYILPKMQWLLCKVLESALSNFNDNIFIKNLSKYSPFLE